VNTEKALHFTASEVKLRHEKFDITGFKLLLDACGLQQINTTEKNHEHHLGKCYIRIAQQSQQCCCNLYAKIDLIKVQSMKRPISG